jgi:alpha-beta hydrolase superfamily lysophospholipase
VRPRTPRFGTDDRQIETSLLVFDTPDHHSWDAMLFQPREGELDPRAAALVIHGSVGNYLSGMPRRLAFGLARRGVTVMTANTRMANFGAFFGTGLLDRVPLDLDAAIRALRRRGYRRVVLVGYSMGSTVVSHYQAVHEPPEVVGVCTLAHPLSLPLSLRRRWERFGSDPSYNEMSDIVRRGLRGMDDPASDRIIIVRRASGPTDRPEHAEIWTYRTWWHSRGPEALQAESRRWVGLLGVPLALIQAGDDQLIRREEGRDLMRLARDGGCPEVHLEYIEDADHVFRGYEADAVDAAQTWIAALLERTRPAAAEAPGPAEVSPRP